MTTRRSPLHFGWSVLVTLACVTGVGAAQVSGAPQPAAGTAPMPASVKTTAAKTRPAKTTRQATTQTTTKSAGSKTKSRSSTTAAKSAAPKDGAPRRLTDVHIEGEMPVPQVLFITARDQRRYVDFQHQRYLRDSRALGAATATPTRVSAAGDDTPH
jgi:hypothetical protein